MPTAPYFHSQRVRQLARNAGVDLVELPPRFSLRSYPLPEITEADEINANALVAEETAKVKKSRLSIRGRKQHVKNAVIEALSRVVQEDGPPGQARRLLQLGGIEDAGGVDAREQQPALPQTLLRTTVDQANFELARLFSLFASREQLVDAMDLAIAKRNLRLIQILFENGTDPNDFKYTFHNAATTDENSLLELFLRAPIRVSPELLKEARTAAIATSCVTSTGLLIQADPSNFSDRGACLQKAFQTTRFDIFITIVYFTGTLAPHNLAGLLEFTTRNAHSESPATNAMIEALLCAGANSLIHEATNALLTCVEREMTSLVRLLIVYNVPVLVAAAQQAIYAAQDELVDLLLAHSGEEPGFAGQCVASLPRSVPEAHRLELLQKLVGAGASGSSLNQELIRAISLRQIATVSALLRHGAEPGCDNGRALITALETQQIPVLQQLLRWDIPRDVREKIFPRLSQLDKLSRRLMTKLFVASGDGMGVDILSQTLLNCIQQDPAGRDEELIKVLTDAGARCDWNGGKTLQLLVNNGEVRLFCLLLDAFYQGPAGNRSKIHLPSEIFAILFKSSLEVSEPSDRSILLKQLIINCEKENDLAVAFCTFLTSNACDVELLDMFLKKDSLDLHSKNGEAIVDAALLCDQTVLERVLRSPGISPQTIQFAASRLIDDIAMDENERATKLALLFRGRRYENIATNALRHLVSCCVRAGIAELDWRRQSISSLLAAGADVNIESGSFLVEAVRSGAKHSLVLFLSQKVQEQSLDSALQHASQLDDLDQRFEFCKIILAANPSRDAASNVLTEVAWGGDIRICTLLLDSGASAGLRCMTNSMLGDHLELLELLLTRSHLEPTLLGALWTQIGPISSSEPRSTALSEILLKVGFTGQPVAETLLDAARCQDIELCAKLLDYEMPCFREAPIVISPVSSDSIQLLPSTSSQQHTVLDEGLLRAVDASQVDLVGIFIAHGASTNCLSGEAINKAITNNSVPILDILLDSLSESEAFIGTELCLRLAANLGLVEVCTCLLQRLPEGELDDEETMRIATSKGDLELLRAFLEANPTNDTLEASLAACQSLEDPIKTRSLTAIFESGFGESGGRCHSLDTYLLSEVQSPTPSVSAVRLFLRYGASPDHEDGQSILAAARARNSEILRVLLQASSRDDMIDQCFQESVNSGTVDSTTLDLVRFLGNEGVSEGSLTSALVTIVDNYLADEGLATEIVQVLVELGADVDDCDGSLLCCASNKGSPHLLRALVSGSPSKESRMTAIHVLSQSEAPDGILVESLETLILEPEQDSPHVANDEFQHPILELLLLSQPHSHGLLSRFFLSRLAVSHNSEISIIQWALSQQNPRISDGCIRVLIENVGQRAHLAEVDGLSWVMTAVENQRHDIIEDLVSRGASLNVVEENAESPLLVASRKGYLGAVRCLRALGASQDDGSLHEAAVALHVDIMEELLDAGHDVNFASSLHGGRGVLAQLCLICSPLGISGGQDLRRLQPVIRLLMDRGAYLGMEWEGKSPLFLAMDNPNPALAAALISTASRSAEAGQRAMLSSALYFGGGFCYSLTTYLTKSIPPPNSWGSEKTEMFAEILKRYGVPDVFYATEGAQPDDAVGVPEEIFAAEQERQQRELLLSRDCEVCGDKPTGLDDCFGSITSTCTHEWENIICGSCLQQYIASRTGKIDGFVPETLPCWAHGCNEVLGHGEVQKVASAEVFAEYDSALMRQAVHAGENYIECAHPNCEGGGWYEPEAVSYIYCEVCKQSTCIACNTPGHIDRLCPNSEEAKRQRREQQAADDLATENLVGQISKPCPGTGCGVAIQKNAGCDHMTCRRCKYEFCWLCFADYNAIRRQGNSAHVRTCTYYR